MPRLIVESAPEGCFSAGPKTVKRFKSFDYFEVVLRPEDVVLRPRGFFATSVLRVPSPKYRTSIVNQNKGANPDVLQHH